MDTIYLALGSNIGKRQSLIEQATRLLSDYAEGGLVASSHLFRTEPEGFSSEHTFLNGVIALLTERSPEDWLRYSQSVEIELGRTTKSKDGKHYDRPIDIDILVYGNHVGSFADGDLLLPHPRMHLRRFVLEPISEIAPKLIHPTLGLSMVEMLSNLPS